MGLDVGSIVEGIVSGITKFGAFISLPEGKRGMVHISEISDIYVQDISEHLAVEEKVKVKILGIDDQGRISLSIRQVMAPTRPQQIDFSSSRNNRNESFEDKMSRFTKESEDRLLDIRRNLKAKRGGGYDRRG